ncbi:MAG: glycosyltransferase family 39 protein [Terriglobales bacterium]|jgi:4-amino-4-deoxy-L-arabinose transferase-like glycosyltransferase
MAPTNRRASKARANTAAAPVVHFSEHSWWSGDVALLIYLAAATVLVHLITGGQYGFHRDELATLDDARHLAWGYVAYPPVTPLFGRLSLILFGTSLTGFRFFAAVAEAAAVVLTGLMAREMGARRGAQLIAAAAALPFCLGGGTLMQYVSFDYLCWVLAAYFVVRLLATGDARWWLAIGASIGLGMMTKYTMGFFALGIVVGVFFTDARRYIESKWLWIGVALSVLIFLPNFVWQVQNHFVSFDFLQDIHARDVRIGRTHNFLPGQLNMTLLAFPLWMAGLYFSLFSRAGRQFRMIGFMYVVPLLLFIAAKGRDYYLAPAYPMLYAAGSIAGEQWLRSLSRTWANVIRVGAWTALTADVVIACVFFLPVAPVNSGLAQRVFKLQYNFREEIGWQELVQTVAGIRDSLPARDRSRFGVLAGNYGEAGAINLYGPAYGLPSAISGMNSFWQRGYGDPPPDTLIVIGVSRNYLDRHFIGCEVAGHISNRYGIQNEETQEHPDLFICRGPRQPWPQFWQNFRYYG